MVCLPRPPPPQVSHTEPDHSYLVPAVLDLYPEATVVASKVALNFLGGLTNRWVGLPTQHKTLCGSAWWCMGTETVPVITV